MIDPYRLQHEPDLFSNPVDLCKALWPHSYFYDKECDMLMAMRTANEVYVVAGNELGKDFTLGRASFAFWISPWTFFEPSYFYDAEARSDMVALASARGCTVQQLPEHLVHQRRIVTTSVKSEHLNVLWGEIGNAWRTCIILDSLKERFVMNEHEIRFAAEKTERNAASYFTAKVSGSENMEGLTGHHAYYTLAAGDESSGLDDRTYEALNTWAKLQVYIGNPKPCFNFFKRNFRAGDLVSAL